MPTEAQFKATGLFTRLDYVRTEERAIYKIFYETMFADLGPVTTLEQSYANEIAGATWRLRRCSTVEGELADYQTQDPLLEEKSEKIIRSIDVGQRGLSPPRSGLDDLRRRHRIGRRVRTVNLSGSLESRLGARGEESCHRGWRRTDLEYRRRSLPRRYPDRRYLSRPPAPLGCGPQTLSGQEAEQKRWMAIHQDELLEEGKSKNW